MAAGNIAVNVFARTAKFQAGMTRASSSLKIFQTAAISTVGTLKALSGAFLPLAGLAAFGSVVKGAESMNQKLNAVAAVAGGLSAGEMQQLKAAAIDVGRVTKFSGSEAAEGLRFLKAGGLSTAAAIEALPVSAKFAQASLMDLGDATDRLIIATSAMGLSSEDAAQQMSSMQRVADVLAKGSTLAATTVSDISDALNTAAGSANLAGLSLEETVSTIIALQKRGFTGVKAGDALRQMLDFTAKAAVDNAGAWEEMGIKVVDANDQFRGTRALMEDMNRVLGKQGFTELQASLDRLGLPVKATKGFKALLDASEEIDRFTKATQKAGGAAEKMADQQLTPLQRGWANLKAAIEQVSTPLFTPIINALGATFEKMGDGLRKVVTTWSIRWELVKVSALIALDAIRAGTAATFNAAIKGGAFFIKNFRAVMMDLRALGVAGLEALGLAVGRTFDLVGQGLVRLKARVLETFKGIGQGASGLGEGISAAIKAGMRLEDPAAAFQTAFAASIGALAQGSGGIFDGLKDQAAAIAGETSTAFDAALKREGFGKALPELGRVVGDEFAETFADRLDKGLLKKRANLQAALAKALAGGDGAGGRGFVQAFIDKALAFASGKGAPGLALPGGAAEGPGAAATAGAGGPTGALLSGSSEAFSAIQEFRRSATEGAVRDPVTVIEKTGKEQVKEIKNGNDLLNEMVDLMREQASISSLPVLEI